MERQALVCPVCGAPYRRAVPSGVAQVRCSYCGAAILIPTNAPRCPNHPDALATAVCNDCGNEFCRDCLTAYNIGGEEEAGTLQLCSNCLANRHVKRAEQTMWAGFALFVVGLLSMLIYWVLGILVVLLAVLIIVYGVRSGRSSQTMGAFPSEQYSALEKEKPYRATQEIYQDTLREFIKSFGTVRGTLMLENRIKAYMGEGLSKEEAIRKLAEDTSY